MKIYGKVVLRQLVDMIKQEGSYDNLAEIMREIRHAHNYLDQLKAAVTEQKGYLSVFEEIANIIECDGAFEDHEFIMESIGSDNVHEVDVYNVDGRYIADALKYALPFADCELTRSRVSQFLRTVEGELPNNCVIDISRAFLKAAHITSKRVIEIFDWLMDIDLEQTKHDGINKFLGTDVQVLIDQVNLVRVIHKQLELVVEGSDTEFVRIDFGVEE